LISRESSFVCHQRCEDEQIALCWSHDLKTRGLTIEGFIYSKIVRFEAAKKTNIQVGGCCEQGYPGFRGLRLKKPSTSATGFNQVLVV
jgi:hypothetical protein